MNILDSLLFNGTLQYFLLDNETGDIALPMPHLFSIILLKKRNIPLTITKHDIAIQNLGCQLIRKKCFLTSSSTC